MSRGGAPRPVARILGGFLGPFALTAMVLLPAWPIVQITGAGTSLPALLAPFGAIAATALGLKTLTPVLTRFRVLLSIVYFLGMLSLQLLTALYLMGYLFGEWL
jgi:hypothetical protein